MEESWTYTTKVRVRYAETDAMGYVYHGNYPQYYELARIEMFKAKGISYRKMEEDGYIMPIREMNIKYYKPARFDDELTIVVKIKTPPTITLTWSYEIYNETGELVSTAEITAVFADAKTGKPSREAARYFSEIVKSK